jgi:hypothetical protein
MSICVLLPLADFIVNSGMMGGTTSVEVVVELLG